MNDLKMNNLKMNNLKMNSYLLFVIGAADTITIALSSSVVTSVGNTCLYCYVDMHKQSYNCLSIRAVAPQMTSL